jgi:hypothetical protein
MYKELGEYLLSFLFYYSKLFHYLCAIIGKFARNKQITIIYGRRKDYFFNGGCQQDIPEPKEGVE